MKLYLVDDRAPAPQGGIYVKSVSPETLPQIVGHTSSEGGLWADIKRSWNSPRARMRRMQRHFTIRTMSCAIILAILFLTLGFGRTIGVLFLLAAGYLIGGVLDKNPTVLGFLRRMR